MLISRKRKFIFIHIYKNAGVSVTSALLPFAANGLQRRYIKLLRRIPSTRLSPEPFATHISAPQLIEKIGALEFERYFSFAVVRNPWDWQVSLYHYMLKSKDHFQHEMIHELGDFKSYLRWRCAEEVQLQRDFICSSDGGPLVDFIARFEHLDQDFATICERLGVSTALPRLNVSNTIPYQDFYDRESVDLVGHAFAADIRQFGYRFEPDTGST